jgi:hypothetical protein
MKTQNKLKLLSVRTYVLGALLGLMFLISCEKDNEFPVTYCESTDIKTESLVIHKSDWCCIDNYMEVCLPVKGYRKGVDYSYIKVYIKAEKPGSSVEEWMELPFGATYYRLDDFKIFVDKYDEINQNEYYFLVEMKVKS